MAEQIKVKGAETSREAVALDLLLAMQRLTNGVPTDLKKEQFLDLYVDCLKAVKGLRSATP